MLGPREAQGQEDEVGADEALAPRDLNHAHLVVDAVPAHRHDLDADNPAAAVPDELLRRDAELANVLPTVAQRRLLMAVVGAEDHRPVRPRVAPRALLRRLRQELEVDDLRRALAHRRPDAVVACVTTSDDDHAFVLGIDRRRLRGVEIPRAPPATPVLADVAAVEQRPGVHRQVVHGHVDALELAARDVLHVPAHGRASGQQHRIVLVQ
mmetsp:Transcript_116062/g.335181  ORF Transcript_116062/g.335181 Transcript_116062/m.335181 type:complete len:210 (+) Transcript_116062:454-1083(+)